jgi:D-glycero-alpha-D-manno-heptose-7-phosphate kinase
MENCQTIDEIKHPSVREVLHYLGINRGLEVHHDADLPARSGMGSSSAFTVGFLNALHALQGRMISKHQLATESIHVEQEILKETVGSQDQVLAAYGGFNHIDFLENGGISVRPITIPQERVRALNSHLMLFYTGIKRTASQIADSYDLSGKRQQLRLMLGLVNESLSILNSDQDLMNFGKLLHEAWQVKRSLSDSVSNPYVDELYDLAISIGAVGGKLTGAGGGGFMLLFVPPDLHQTVRDKLDKIIYVPFKFESSGSQIIFFDREEDYAAEERIRADQPISDFQELNPPS